MADLFTGIPTEPVDGSAERQQQLNVEAAQQGGLETVGDTLANSYAAKLWRWGSDQIAADRTPVTNKDLLANKDQLITPRMSWEDQRYILNRPSMDLAKRASERIEAERERESRLAQQLGIGAGTIQFATGLVDLDLPLVLASGGTVAAGKTALSAARVARMAGAGVRTAKTAGALAVGASGGALSGAIVSTGAAAADHRFGIDDFFMQIAASTALGSVINTTPVTGMSDRVWQNAAAREVAEAVRRTEVDIHTQIADPDSALKSTARPVDDPAWADSKDSIGAASMGTAERATDIDKELAGVEARRAKKSKKTRGVKDNEPDLEPLDPLTEKLMDQGASEAEIRTTLENREWVRDSGYKERIEEAHKSKTVKLLTGASDFEVMGVPVGKALGQLFTIGVREYTNLAFSKAPTANWIAGEILESASGITRKGSTAALEKEKLFYNARMEVSTVFRDTRANYFKARGNNRMASVFKSDAEFGADVRIQMARHRQGLPVSKELEPLIEAIDRMNEKLLVAMKGDSPETSVRGAENIPAGAEKGYFKYDIIPEKVLDAQRKVGEDAVVDAFTRAYKKRWPDMKTKVARRIAKASVRRRLEQARGIDAADRVSQQTDVTDSIDRVLRDEGVNKADREHVLQIVGKRSQEKSKQTFLKDRVELDMEERIDGTNYRIVDLMSDNLEESMLRYAHAASGAAALARRGLRSGADIDQLVNALARESAALGEDIDPARIRAMFSQFTGGVHAGVDPLTGRTTQGASTAVSVLGSATRASLLQRLGLTTLMDSANVFAANGFAKTYAPLIERIGFKGMDKARLRAIEKGLADIQFLTGQDHLIYRSHLAVDETAMNGSGWGDTIVNGVRTIENATYYASGHHHMLGFIQRVSADATFSNLYSTLKTGKGMSERQLADMGLGQETLGELQDLIRKGDLSLEEGNYNVDLSGMSKEGQEELSSAMYRAVNQQAQRGLTGESSMWMNSDVGKVLGALKTFGMLATQKQLARNLIVGGKPQAMTTAVWQMGFAYAVISTAQAINGTEMSPFDRARLALAYSPNLGIIPNTIDPVSTMLGFEDLNFSPYGRFSSPFNSPVVETVEKLAKAPGGIVNTLSGEGSYDDMQNARAMFFLNWYGAKRFWE